jgi:hypothetical protein
VVYEGVWQGAPVAVKFSLAPSMDDINSSELLVSRMLGHPNVVHTYSTKVAVLDEQARGAQGTGFFWAPCIILHVQRLGTLVGLCTRIGAHSLCALLVCDGADLQRAAG